MHLRTLHTLTALALALPVCADQEPPETWFERLGSLSAHDRNAAQRWLATHLEAEHYPLLAARARGADPETSRRLALALGSDGRHLGLVVLLLGERDAGLVQLGERAFEDLVTRWCPGATVEPSGAAQVIRLLVGEPEGFFVGPSRFERLELTVDRLARLGDLGLPLVLAPGLADSEVPVASKTGRLLEHLSELCADHGLTFVGVGEWEGDEPGQGAWILVLPRSGAASRSGVALLASWCRSVERAGTGASAAAHALAATGWPAALEWLDQRWSRRQDQNALDGLLTAAARGRVGRSLQLSADREVLLARADDALTKPEPGPNTPESAVGDTGAVPAQRFAERVARALIGAGPMILGGADWSASLTEGWDGLNDAQRWLRLVILEGQRGGGERVAGFLRALVESSADLPVVLRFQALRALAAHPSVSASRVDVAGAGELVELALERDRADELLLLLDALGGVPLPESASADPQGRRFVLRQVLQSGDIEAAAHKLRLCVSDLRRPTRSPLVETLAQARLECGPRRVMAVAERALAELEGEARALLLEACLLAGCMDGRRQSARLEELLGSDRRGADDLETIGALVAGPAGARARRELLKLLRNPPEEELLLDGLARGLDRAVQTLQRAGLDREYDALVRSVWGLVSEPHAPLHLRLTRPGWPRSAPPIRIYLTRLERELPAELW